jgi:hypothetical protein
LVTPWNEKQICHRLLLISQHRNRKESQQNSVFLLPAGPNLDGERNSDESEKLFRKVQLAGVGRGAGFGILSIADLTALSGVLKM